MRIEPLGDTTWIVRDLGSLPPYAVAESIRNARLKGVEDAIGTAEAVGVYGGLPEEILQAAQEAESMTDTARALRDVPVCFELESDLEEISASLGIESDQVLDDLCAATFEVEAIGFCPGFPYLKGLPASLYGLPRLARPRSRVPAGSVAITGDRAGIYPLERPGGWQIIGRTPCQIVDVEDEWHPIEAGDMIRFQPIGLKEFQERAGERL